MPGDFDTTPVIIGKRKGPMDKTTLNREIAKGNVEVIKKGPYMSLQWHHFNVFL
jgi:hypothetical protein